MQTCMGYHAGHHPCLPTNHRGVLQYLLEQGVPPHAMLDDSCILPLAALLQKEATLVLTSRKNDQDYLTNRDAREEDITKKEPSEVTEMALMLLGKQPLPTVRCSQQLL